MTDPLVSVKMITYNHAPFIAQAIDGVLQQKTNFPFELIIGEDCSTDGTREIVFEYQKKHPDIIRVITSDKNVGGTNNSSRASKACRGMYVAFCEGDDYWQSPHKLQRQADCLERDPECGWVFSDYDLYYQREKKTLSRINFRKGFYSPENMTIEKVIGPEGGVIRTCTVMIRRNLLEQICEGDPLLHQSGHFRMGDTQLFAELTLITKVSYCPESMATYRLHDESATRSKDPVKMALFWNSAYEMKLYLCDKHKLAEHIRKKAESDWLDSSLRLAFHSRSRKLADEVRRKKKTFTWDEWFRYYGAGNIAIYHMYRVSSFLRHAFKKERNQLM